MAYTKMDRAMAIINYAIAQAPTLQDASDAFNAIQSQINGSTYAQLKVLIDAQLA